MCAIYGNTSYLLSLTFHPDLLLHTMQEFNSNKLILKGSNDIYDKIIRIKLDYHI